MQLKDMPFLLFSSCLPPCPTCIPSQAVGDGTGVKPIYEVLMQLKGMPLLLLSSCLPRGLTCALALPLDLPPRQSVMVQV